MSRPVTSGTAASAQTIPIEPGAARSSATTSTSGCPSAATARTLSEPGSERTASAAGRPAARSGSSRFAKSSTSPGTR